MTSSQYGPYVQGCTRATMGGTDGTGLRRGTMDLLPIHTRGVYKGGRGCTS